ncbi:hypothetical protein GCM10027515_17400 [Schumannella luteola]|uniref:Uncharacterized protein n=1 Tax=Schumannella luteola TaxID=472059 RepID=A0A852YH39_9MICO|nr:hypothetical protein [Schumannella luteola]NYH00462.1 hypothetical protein [Schumannella luteola]TPX02298.1 hypothetical protein FJ656_23100 [Schumannella luteola]
MQWFNDIVDWFGTARGHDLVFGAIIPFVAIVIGAIIAALIGRGAVKRLVGQRDRETRAAAVAALIAAGQTAARWDSQAPQTREHFATLAAAADVQVRLLPLPGAALAADWAAHELTDMRTNSVSYSFQADQTLAEYRDRLIEWQNKPGRARKLFAADLDRWRYDEPQKVDPVVLQQQEWAEKQFTAATSAQPEKAAERPLSTPTAATPAAADAETRSYARPAAATTTAPAGDADVETRAVETTTGEASVASGTSSADAESESATRSH